MLQLIVFSLLFGLAIAMVGERAKPVANLLSRLFCHNENGFDHYVLCPHWTWLLLCPIIGELGPQILAGYLRAFVLYLIDCLFITLGSLPFMLLLREEKSIKYFWKNAITPSITAIATCSSAACIPVNLDAVKKMGVPRRYRRNNHSSWCQHHKDGSVFGGVLKLYSFSACLVEI